MTAINVIAGVTTRLTIGLMRNVTPFAAAVYAHDGALLPTFRAIAYGTVIPLSLAYLWPLYQYFRAECPQPAPLVIRRRAISFPTVVGFAGFGAWAASAVVFPFLTIVHFGDWSLELMSQQVLSPLVNGFFAATSAYLFTDWVARCAVIPKVFPDGGTSNVSGALTLGVRARLFVFLGTVAFLPLFTMLGLVRSARARFEAGLDMPQVLSMLDTGSTWVFGVYVTLGLLLTMLMARSFTGPLAAVATALRRIQRGDLDVGVPVVSGDELGLVEQGVNDMATSLRERERILTAFGRVVEPAVRDRLLAGGMSSLAEKKAVTVLFCDLRGFTAFAERTPPEEVVATLNEFFTSVTQWVRGCGGFVDKFIGDALLVVFGLFDSSEHADGGNGPGHDDAGARTAVECAIGIRERLRDLNRVRAAAGKSELAVAMAIHTGEVLAGVIGAEDRHEYTVIGDTVNSAARLLEVCKERNCDLIVSGPTYERAARAGAVVDVSARDSVKLRGRAENITALLLA